MLAILRRFERDSLRARRGILNKYGYSELGCKPDMLTLLGFFFYQEQVNGMIVAANAIID